LWVGPRGYRTIGGLENRPHERLILRVQKVLGGIGGVVVGDVHDRGGSILRLWVLSLGREGGWRKKTEKAWDRDRGGKRKGVQNERGGSNQHIDCRREQVGITSGEPFPKIYWKNLDFGKKENRKELSLRLDRRGATIGVRSRGAASHHGKANREECPLL